MIYTMRAFSSVYAFNPSRFGLQRATCIANGAENGGGGAPEDTANLGASQSRDSLCEKIAGIIHDYRNGEICPRTPEVVDKWAAQFDETDQLPILEEMAHILERMYFSETKVREFIRTAISSPKLTGDGDPSNFWRKAGVLDLQESGSSQKTMLSILDHELQNKYDHGLDGCKPDKKNFVYLDDGIFSGNQIIKEPKENNPPGHIWKWLQDNPNLSDFTLHMVVIAPYKSGVGYVEKGFHEIAKPNGNIVWPFRSCDIGKIIPNWKNGGPYSDNQPDNVEVLWPRCLPHDMLANPDVEKWMKREHENTQTTLSRDIARLKGKSPRLFRSEEGRHILEQAFLRKGAHFCSQDNINGRNQHTRPLGNQVWRGWGFGAMFVTYRNCANNCPLALWWKNNGWVPLFPRRH